MNFENNFLEFLKNTGREKKTPSRREKISFNGKKVEAETISVVENNIGVLKKKQQSSSSTDMNSSNNEAGASQEILSEETEMEINESPSPLKNASTIDEDACKGSSEEMNKESHKKQSSPAKAARDKNSASSSKSCDFLITYQDLPEISISLPQITHFKPKFELPPPTNPKHHHLPFEERVKLLNDHVDLVNKVRADLARQSLFRAPMPKPIMPSSRCKASLVKRTDDEVEEDEIPVETHVENVYVSRSGRHCKRRSYNDYAGLDSELDSEETPKRLKIGTDINGNDDLKITMDNPVLVIPESRRYNHANDVNLVETETPTRKFTKREPKRSRSEMMFDEMVKDVEKKQKQEDQLEEFKKTLASIDEDEDGFEEKPAVDVTEKPFVRRVPPPLPIKKTRKVNTLGLRKQEDLDKIEVMPASPKRQPRAKTVLKGKSIIKQIVESDSTTLENVSCPLCNKEFSADEVQDHASNCGGEASSSGTHSSLPVHKHSNKSARERLMEFEEDDVIPSSSTSDTVPCPLCTKEFSKDEIQDHASTCCDNSGPKPGCITCEVCDKVFELNSSYEVHVSQCIAGRVDRM